MSAYIGTKAARKWTGQIGSGGVADASVTTIPIQSATGLTNGAVYVFTVDRVDSNGVKTSSKEEVIKGTLSGTNFVSCTRGVAGTAQAHSAGAVVEILSEPILWNELIEALEVEHGSDGTHSFGPVFTVQGNASQSSELRLEEDTDNGDHYVSLKAPASLSGNLPFTLPSADGTNGQFLKTNGSGILSFGSITVRTDGWEDGTAYTWTYASASSFTISGVDLTAVFQKGTYLRFKQGGSYKYAIVSSSSFSTNTTVNIIVNTDYTIANSAITDNYYSYQANPEGFPDSFNYTISTTWNGTPPSGSKTQVAQYSVKGRTCFVRAEENNTVAGTTNGTFSFSGPIAAALDPIVYHAGGMGAMSTQERSSVPTAVATAVVYGTAPVIYLSLATSINAKSAFCLVSYPI